MSESLDFDPQHFITIRWDDDEERWELDLGDINLYEAIGVLRCAISELEERQPKDIKVRFGGVDLDPEEEDEEPQDE